MLQHVFTFGLYREKKQPQLDKLKYLFSFCEELELAASRNCK